MIKLLMVLPGLDKRLGGIVTFTNNIYDYLNEYCDLTIVATYKSGEMDFIDDKFKNNNKVKLYESSRLINRFSKEAYLFIANEIANFDIVHIHGLWHGMAYPAARLALRKNINYIISPHGMLEKDALKRSRFKKNFFWKLTYRHVFSNAKAIHCIARSEVDNTAEIVPDSKIFFVPNGVGLVKNTTVKKTDQLLFIGRLHPKKGVDLLINGFKLIENKNIKLIIAGTGDVEYEDYLKKLVPEGFKNRVNFIGFVDGDLKRQLIEESAVICVPSFSEGMPLVALEALAAGTPLLITKASNMPEVSEFYCGIEIEDNAPETLATSISMIFSSDLEKMSKNSVALVKEKFHIEEIAKKIYDKYKTIKEE